MGKPTPESYGDLPLVDGKPKHICRVKFCRTNRAKGKTVCCKHHMMAWRKANPIKAAYNTLRDHAKRRRIEFALTLEQFESIVVPSGYMDHKGNHAEDLHLDRTDPLKGYIYGNITVMTCSENSAKGASFDKRAYVDARIAARQAAKAEQVYLALHKHEQEDYNPF